MSVSRDALLSALRSGPSVKEAARAAGCARQHVYRVARRDPDVAEALRLLRSRGGQGRSQVTADMALNEHDLEALAAQLRAELKHPNVWRTIRAAVRLLNIARALRLLPEITPPAEVSPVVRS